MQIIKVVDKYNNNKVWLIKKYSCGNYYINQNIYDKKMYKSFVRTTKKHIKEIIN